MCDLCNFARSQHSKGYGRTINREMTDRFVNDWDIPEDDDDDPRCDFEKDPSMANGWFFNI